MPAPLTVVITSFNRRDLIGPAIESVLRSDFRDFELLILDDASVDGTAEVAKRYALRDKRVRVVINERNKGQFGNRNRAVELVSTPYLKYHDSDDLMYPHCLGTMTRLLGEEPRAGFALSASRGWSGGPCPIFVTPRAAYLREYLGEGMFFGGPANALFRLEVLRELGGFPERGVGSDYLFWLRACARVPVLLVPADLFWYRRHAGQELVGASAPRDYAEAQGEAWRALLSPDCPLEGEALREAKRRCAARLLKLTWRDLQGGRWSLARLRLKHAGVRFVDWIRYRPRLRSRPISMVSHGEGTNEVQPSWIRWDPGEGKEAPTTDRSRAK